jgi:hypothetical protein
MAAVLLLHPPGEGEFAHQAASIGFEDRGSRPGPACVMTGFESGVECGVEEAATENKDLLRIPMEFPVEGRGISATKEAPQACIFVSLRALPNV